ncbi:glycerol kinase [Backusella circina FSU 941]|nr:glycerol kinase [Backusella circina FSU 941]
MAKQQLIGAIDQGTTSTRFIVFNKKGEVITYHQIEFAQHYSHPGWIEHDPYDLLASVETCIEHTVRKLTLLGHEATSIICVGITNQRETAIVWDNKTGMPLYPAIVWSDSRTSDTVKSLINSSEKGTDVLRAVCGLPLTNYSSAVKLKWMLDNVTEVKDALDKGRLQFGTVDTWLIYNLTGGAKDNGVLVTDVSNASRTMLMDIHKLEWSDEAKRFFGFEELEFAKIVPSSSVYGKITYTSLKYVPIAGCLGDQHSALVGQKCFHVGDVKSTFGTGSFMLKNTGENPIYSENGLLTTVAYQLGDKPCYALEGSIASAGSSIKWLRDNLNMIDDSKEMDKLAKRVKNTAGVYFITAFTGLLAPYWRDDARGTICGITQFTKREHIARATFEAVCYQTRALLDALDTDSEKSLHILKVDGGMSSSDVCMQILADLLDIEVHRPELKETTALGAAIAAGLAVGIWKSEEDLDHVNNKKVQVFKSQITEEKREKMYIGWKEAVTRSLGWAKIVDEQEKMIEEHQ